MIVEFYEDVVQISGALKSNFWETIHTAISLALKKHPNGVIVDCSGITECTVEGADTFRDAMEFIKRQDARIILAAVPAEVLEIFKSVPEVRSQLAIASSVEEARHSMDLPEHELVKGGGASLTGVQVACLLFGGKADKVALQTATIMVRPNPGHMHIVFPIVVPRDLPLQAPLPHQEDLAFETVEAAKTYLKEQHVRCSVHIERGRDAASIMALACEENHVTSVVVPLPCAAEEREAAIQVTRNALAKLSCMVLFVRDRIA